MYIDVMITDNNEFLKKKRLESCASGRKEDTVLKKQLCDIVLLLYMYNWGLFVYFIMRVDFSTMCLI